MTSIQAASERETPVDLRELLNDATEGPLPFLRLPLRVTDDIVWGNDGDELDVAENAALIAGALNAAPFLLDVEQKAQALLDEPEGVVRGDDGGNPVCLVCGSHLDGEYAHRDGFPCAQLEAALAALDSHLSAASERETPE